jgi:hypothetical protein
MLQRSLRTRIERLEQFADERAKRLSRRSENCICFPETEPPFFGFPIEGKIAFAVKCPLHGDRFKWPRFLIYVSKWRRESEQLRRQRLSERYQKAWDASFPSDLWLAGEEETNEGIYLRLKDGSRLLAHEFSWQEPHTSGHD